MFYKTQHPDVMLALENRRIGIAVLREQAKAFGAVFGGTGILKQSGGGRIEFGGVQFATPRPRTMWTAVDALGCQRPLSSAKRGITHDERAEWRACHKLWKDNVPHGVVDNTELYDALGTSWGTVFLVGMKTILKDGWFYVAGDVFLSPDRATEILGSEWEAVVANA